MICDYRVQFLESVPALFFTSIIPLGLNGALTDSLMGLYTKCIRSIFMLSFDITVKQS